MPSVGLGSKAEEESIASRIAGGERLVLAQGWEIIRWKICSRSPPWPEARGRGRFAGRSPSCGGGSRMRRARRGGASRSAGKLKNIVSELKLSQGTLTLDKATITEVKTVGLGHRSASIR